MDEAKYWRIFYKIQEIMFNEFDMTTKNANIVAEETAINFMNLNSKKVENDFTIVVTNNEVYHTYLNELEKDLRQFVDKFVISDHYFLALDLNSEDIFGGFAINEQGELQGLFSLEKGMGKKLFQKQVSIATKMGFDNLYLTCIGEHLKELYEEFGFEWYNICRWDERLAPKDWNGERFDFPNIYRMKLELK